MQDATDGAADGASDGAADGAADSAAHLRAEAVIDLRAVEHNTRLVLSAARAVNPAAELMAVVKADGYGHGAEQVAAAALRAGATALGVATPTEAMALIAAGHSSTADRPIVAWLWVPDEDIAPAVAAGVQLVVYSPAHLEAVTAVAASAPGGVALIHLKIDTGLGRGGAVPAAFDVLARAAAAAQQPDSRNGQVEVVGVMSHLACADEPGAASVPVQIAVFEAGCRTAAEAGLTVRWRHLANTPGVLEWPGSVFDLVRCGIGLYGISPFEAPHDKADRLRPVMTLRARVALTKRVPAGHGVSYGLRYRTATETTLALVPLGYADGIPRTAGPEARVLIAGRLRPIAGRIAMDQFVVDCGDDDISPGDEVLILGPGAHGEPTAVNWADACGTIGYEIVTRISSRVPRRYVGST
ncbi:alanine racemase [Nakamurella sp. UYEF19]|uniref:alanine racemase n=1 Tax=Nakamurella sp. UYEF19 TaxID=1756392 RepID=UPI0033918C28